MNKRHITTKIAIITLFYLSALPLNGKLSVSKPDLEQKIRSVKIEKIKEFSSYDQVDEDKSSYDQVDEDIDLLAKAIYGEARGASRKLKIATAQTVLNRTGKNKWWGNTLKEVILKPKQYSSFNPNDPNYNKVMNPLKYEELLKYEKLRTWDECLEIAKAVLESKFEDLSKGATHYHTTSVKPLWARGQTPIIQIENTIFYKLEN